MQCQGVRDSIDTADAYVQLMTQSSSPVEAPVSVGLVRVSISETEAARGSPVPDTF